MDDYVYIMCFLIIQSYISLLFRLKFPTYFGHLNINISSLIHTITPIENAIFFLSLREASLTKTHEPEKNRVSPPLHTHKNTHTHTHTRRLSHTDRQTDRHRYTRTPPPPHTHTHTHVPMTTQHTYCISKQ